MEEATEVRGPFSNCLSYGEALNLRRAMAPSFRRLYGTQAYNLVTVNVLSSLWDRAPNHRMSRLLSIIITILETL